MSDIFGTPQDRAGASAPAAVPAAVPAETPSPVPSGTVHEAYSFACMNCGHGWEQAYEIAHQVDVHGHTRVVYYAGPVRVPSPLTRPSCGECGGHLVRIMRSGRVSSVSSARWDRLANATARTPRRSASARKSVRLRTGMAAAGTLMADAARRDGDPDASDHARHHWLADFLALFHRKHHQEHEGYAGHGSKAA